MRRASTQVAHRTRELAPPGRAGNATSRDEAVARGEAADDPNAWLGVAAPKFA